MSYSFNNIKEKAICRGDFILNKSNIQRMFDKYEIYANQINFKNKNTGSYYVFITSNNLLVSNASLTLRIPPACHPHKCSWNPAYIEDASNIIIKNNLDKKIKIQYRQKIDKQ